MSATRLLVLGVVRMYGKAHGYQVRRELLTWSADKWANVQPGSIYHALKKMTAEHLLEQVQVEQGDAGPDRVAYRLTEDGETEFQVLLARALSDPADPRHDQSAATALMTMLPRGRVVALLRQQLVRMEGDLSAARLMTEHKFGEPAHVAVLYRLWELHANANVTWLRELIAQLEAGEFVMADDADQVMGEPENP
ncbi:PadR family transcriptional regulator [Amycolatopsis anabasis]|uniref:PadR family transcriptional regulator n=1 Tax=Amycolatopsis anabasis TaxID=1840409 RepID=UPI00131CD0DB|nr:PadR family transcriptional regulator [Amycolatopsis anabasis]